MVAGRRQLNIDLVNKLSMWSYASGLLASLEETQMQQYLAKKKKEKQNTACKHGAYQSTL